MACLTAGTFSAAANCAVTGMATTDSDPCQAQRDALNEAERAMASHREVHGDSDDDQGAEWGEERRRLIEIVTEAIRSYEDCMRSNDPHLPERPDLTSGDPGDPRSSSATGV